MPLLCVLLAVSCGRDGLLDGDGEYSRVFVYCGLGYNNLSPNLETNFEDLCSECCPNPAGTWLWWRSGTTPRPPTTTAPPTAPVLMHVYRDRGVVHADTLKVYPENTVSASADAIREMLLDVKRMFPSESYGMLFSSHATGWIPQGYPSGGEAHVASLQSEDPGRPLPLTKTLGAQYDGNSSNSREIDIRDFADLIPMHLDYIIFDACLLGCVELAWELREVCDKLVFSPTEVLAQGFVYGPMVLNLLGGVEPDLKAVSREYFERYDGMQGDYRSATVSLVDCTKLDRLAEVFGEIVSRRRGALDGISRDEVQKYFYRDNRFPFFYDLRDLADRMAPGEELMSELDAALSDCVLYHAETPSFFEDLLPLERCCGLSVYFPDPAWPVLNDYYRTLGWNGAVRLLE